MHTLKQYRHDQNILREHRELHEVLPSFKEFLGNQQGLDENLQKDVEGFQNIDGFHEMLTHFAAPEAPEPNLGTMFDYVHEKGTSGKPLLNFDRKIDELLKGLESLDPSERNKAKNMLQLIVEFMKKRTEVIKNSQKELRGIAEQTEIPSNYIIDKAKEVFRAGSEAWSDASGQGKLVIAAGLISAFILWRKIEDQKNATGFKGFLGKSFARVKMGVGLTLGAGVAYMGLQTANRAYEKTTGAPLVNLNTNRDLKGDWFPSFSKDGREKWQANKHKLELNNEWERLRGMNIPVERFAEFGGNDPDRVKHAFAITNLCARSVEEFRSLYETHKGSQEIPDEEAPRRPFAKDLLTPGERFNVIERMADALNFIDLNRGELDWKEDAAREKLTVMYLIMDFESLNQNKQKVKLINTAHKDKNWNTWHYDINCRSFVWDDGVHAYFYSLNDRKLITVDQKGNELSVVDTLSRPHTLPSPDGFYWATDKSKNVIILNKL